MKHQFRKDEDGNIDDFALDSGYHNGPMCEVCGEYFCQHCSPKCYDEECPGHTPTIEEAIENLSSMTIPDSMSEQERRSIPVIIGAAKAWVIIKKAHWEGIKVEA